jgi:hypothetical protein
MFSFKKFLATNNPDLLPESQLDEISGELAGKVAARRADSPVTPSDKRRMEAGVPDATPPERARETLRRAMRKPGGAESFLKH